MNIDRRTWLKFIAAGSTGMALGNAAAGGARTVVRSPGSSGSNYAPALDELARYAREELAAVGLPGMTLAVVDAEGFVAVLTLGLADAERQIPVSPAHLFQIGSISKSFAALCIYTLVDAGKVDLDAPLSTYLPEVPLPPEPILVRQALSHTSGLPADAPVFPRVPDGRLWTGFAPGSSFSYSNIGFTLLVKLVEKVCGKPYPLVLRERVIEPLRMHDLVEVVQAKDRARYAVGYSPRDMNGPDLTRTPLGQTPWVNRDDAAGSIGTTSDMMARYLRYLIAVGRGRGAPVLSDEAAARFAAPATPAPLFGDGARYANGLAVIDLDGHSVLHHTGGMIAFSSSLSVDPVSGVGCFASVNGHMGDYRPSVTTHYACRLLRRLRQRAPPPPRPEAPSLDAIEDASAYAGAYVSQGGDRFEIKRRARRLFVLADGREGRLQMTGEHSFQTDHPLLCTHLFTFERKEDTVAALWWGSHLYGRGAPLPQPATPPELTALAGLYVSDGPWIGSARVVVQGQRVVLERYGILRPADGAWRVESGEALCERVRFADILRGLPRRLNLSGQDLWRFDAV